MYMHIVYFSLIIIFIEETLMAVPYRMFMTLFLLLHKIYVCVKLAPIQLLLGTIEYDLGHNLLLESSNIVC